MLLDIHYTSSTYLCQGAQLLKGQYLPSSFSFLLSDLKEGLNNRMYSTDHNYNCLQETGTDIHSHFPNLILDISQIS